MEFSLDKLSQLKKYKVTLEENELIIDEKYIVKEIIGKGAYGVVVSAEDKSETEENKEVAIKKIDNIFEHTIYAKRCLREIKILRLLKHSNIIGIKEVLFPHDENFEDVYVVYELMETDLYSIIKSNQELTEEHIQYFLYQILRGLKYIHSANIIHRDLKPKNLLVNSNCDLKICDFGLSRPIVNDYTSKKNNLTEYVATRWYRAPEVLLSLKKYDKAVDMWSVGCIFAELMGRKPLFPGDDINEQFKLITDMIGTPQAEEIYKISRSKAREYILNYGQKESINFGDIFQDASSDAIDLLNKLLMFDPSKRITVEEALKHPYLKEFHLEDDEPASDEVTNFDFMFENEEEMSKEELRNHIYDEILLYHDTKFYEKYILDKKEYLYKNNS